MTNTLHFSQWRNCIRAQRKVNLCTPSAPKGPKVGMSVRQYEILCANDAGRAPRKYPAIKVIPVSLSAVWGILMANCLPPLLPALSFYACPLCSSGITNSACMCLDMLFGYNHGSHMYSKTSNVLEYNYAVRVPSNVLEWYPMFSMFSKTKIMKKPILFVIFVSVW